MEKSGTGTGAGLAFRKMHGLGNDFVIIDARGEAVALTPVLARAIAERHTGVGCDQIALIEDSARADARVTFLNPDGSTAGACGNASRCVAHLLMTESGRGEVTLETERGVLAAERLPDGMIRVDMGAPLTDWRDIPLAEAADTVALPLTGAPGAVSMGNPHVIFFVPEAEAVALGDEGPRWEAHPLFPARANVGFAEVRAPDEIRLRVWERGTGVTRACGSGACAAVVAGVRKGLLGRRVRVHLDGGPLEIEWRANDGHVLMTGPVAEVFEGRLAPVFLAAHGTGVAEQQKEAAHG